MTEEEKEWMRGTQWTPEQLARMQEIDRQHKFELNRIKRGELPQESAK